MALNKVPRTYSFDLEVIKSFESKITSGDRSRILEELIRDYLRKFFPETTNKSLERDYELKKLEARRNEIYSTIEKEKKEAEEKDKAIASVISSKEEFQRVLERKESLRAKARLVSMEEFGLTDELLRDDKWLRSSKNQELIDRWKSSWRSLTKEFFKKEGFS